MRRRWFLGACVVVVLAALATGLFLLIDRSGRSKPPSAGGLLPSRAVPGFDQVAFKVERSVVPATGSEPKRCALLANTESKRARGLMNRRDLAGYDGMIFAFPQAGLVGFYMKDTIIPLSIAWFDESGRFVSATDMVPCPQGTECQLYYPAAPASIAIEVRQGQLSTLGIGPGSTISVGGPCVT